MGAHAGGHESGVIAALLEGDVLAIDGGAPRPDSALRSKLAERVQALLTKLVSETTSQNFHMHAHHIWRIQDL